MSDFIIKSLVGIMFVYVLVTQLIIRGYEKDTDRLFKVNSALLNSCMLMTEGEDLTEKYMDK